MVLDWCWGGDKAIPLRTCWVRSNKNQFYEWGFLGSYQISYRMTVLWELRFQGSVRSVLPPSAIYRLLLIARLLHFKITVGMGIGQVKIGNDFLFLQRFSHFSWGNKKKLYCYKPLLNVQNNEKVNFDYFCQYLTVFIKKWVWEGFFFFLPFGSAFPDFLKIYFLKAIILKPVQERNRKFTLHCAFPHPQVCCSILIIIAIWKVTWFSDP